MRTLRIIIEILLVMLVLAFIAKDCRGGMVCEGVYLECDSVYYFDSDTSTFTIEPANDTLYDTIYVTHEMLFMHQSGQCEHFDTSTFKIEPE